MAGQTDRVRSRQRSGRHQDRGAEREAEGGPDGRFEESEDWPESPCHWEPLWATANTDDRGHQFSGADHSIRRRDTHRGHHSNRCGHQSWKLWRPLLNSEGEIIGINTAIISQSGGSVGIGFAIPVNTAKKLIPELIAKGYVTYPYIGATIQSLIPEVADYLKLKVQRGAMIAEVVDGGPADKAGLKGGNRRVQVETSSWLWVATSS